MAAGRSAGGRDPALHLLDDAQQPHCRGRLALRGLHRCDRRQRVQPAASPSASLRPWTSCPDSVWRRSSAGFSCAAARAARSVALRPGWAAVSWWQAPPIWNARFAAAGQAGRGRGRPFGAKAGPAAAGVVLPQTLSFIRSKILFGSHGLFAVSPVLIFGAWGSASRLPPFVTRLAVRAGGRCRDPGDSSPAASLCRIAGHRRARGLLRRLVVRLPLPAADPAAATLAARRGS